ncbi:MAG: hypothetical protein HN712_29125 [Gemmatimonadetes bacterium]|nr:hypothetical protein [Gemmatimonadota bacterium]
MLQFASARNEIVNSGGAMRDCIERATSALPSGECDLVVFNTTMGHNFQELLDEARRLCPNAEIVGSSCGGVVGADGASERMRALAVMGIQGKGEFAVASADAIRGPNSREVAAAVAAELKAKNQNINLINIVASGIDIAADQAIAGIESVFGPDVPIIGGTSGDNMQAKVTFQFVGEQILERGIVLIGYADPTLSVVTGVHHGSLAIGKPFEVTKAEANRIFELDGEPAWPHLMKTLDLDPTIEVAKTFAVAGLGQEIPADLRDEYENDHFIHTIFMVDDERQSFYTPASIPVGTRLWLMQRDEARMFEGVDRMVAGLKQKLGSAVPVAVFHTDCAARGRLMFNQILKDEIIARMQYPICEGAEIPWLGIYGFGEFTPLGGRNRFHTQTSSLYALVRR